MSIQPLLKVLVALRILDADDHTISFSNLYLYIGLVVAISEPTTASVALLTLIFVHANLKRYSRHQTAKMQANVNQKMLEHKSAQAQANESNQNELAQLKSQVATLTQIVNLK